MTPEALLNSAKRSICMERDAIDALLPRLDEQFVRACDLLLTVEGRVVVTGMGKSGHIGNKIAATLASTGTPAMFVHPGEASHGDMGMITGKDAVIALSNSGTTAEVLTLLPLLKRSGIPLVAMTGAPGSELARAAEVHLNVGVSQEACPLDLAPTSSTTAALVMGDALAIALLEARGFTAEDFAFSHPGGALGKKLLLKVENIMHRGDGIPAVLETDALSDALVVMSSKALGMTTVTDANGKLTGLFTDGDLRRAIDRGIDIRHCKMSEVMSKNVKTIAPGLLAAQALRLMEDHRITALVVSEDGERVDGVIHTHDILRAGVA